MFGGKRLDASATVVVCEMVKDHKRTINGISMTVATTLRYVLEV